MKNKIAKNLVLISASISLISCVQNKTDESCEHIFTHYLAKEPTCVDAGSIEYWICNECGDIFLEQPSGKAEEGGVPTGFFEPVDVRYIEPDSTKHKYKYIYTEDATLTKDGVLGHYECSYCHKLFDNHKIERNMDYFTIKKTSESHKSIVDEIMSSDAISSTWNSIRENVSKWSHSLNSNKIVVPNNAGWQMTKQAFSDIDLKLKIDGCSGSNPDAASSTCTKSFIIGGNVNPNELNPGEGVYGRYPIGYLINVSNGTNSVNKGIQIYEWKEDKINSISGLTLLGRVNGDFDNAQFRIRIVDKTLTIFDDNNEPLFFNFGPSPNYNLTSLELNNYRGGSIGVFSWTTSNNTEPSSSTFYINDFYGKHLNDTNEAKQFVDSLLSDENSIKSANTNIASNASKWSLANSYTNSVSTANGYDEASLTGSWKLANINYDNFRLDFTVKGATNTNPKNDDVLIKKSILFGANPKGDYFVGYSLTIYDNGKGNGGIALKYHNGSLTGELLGYTTGDFDNAKLSLVVQNSQARVLKDGAEVCGGTSWLKRGNGIPLTNYKGGYVGILSWDNVQSTFSFSNLMSLNDIINENYDEQDPSKRVNVFIFAGQSNMEGNTRAWDNYDTANYLKNYCNSSEHNFDELIGGYSNVQITYHNNYVIKDSSHKQNFSNTEDPLSPKFTSVKVGQGLKWIEKPEMSYVGPELGFAEKINSKASSKNPVFIIKYASGGTYFGNTYLNWRSESSSSPAGYLYTKLLQYVFASLKAIRQQGYIPIVKGIVWHQGESDGTSESFANNYEQYLTNFAYDLKNNLSSFAVDNKARNIAFIDAHVNAQTGTLVSFPSKINAAKDAVAKLSTSNYVIDTNKNGLNLVVGSARFNGGDGWHYTIDSQLILGNAFAEIVIKNNLLDF